MSKIRVLVVPSDRAGVSKYRSVDPHLKLEELYGDEFFVDIITAGTNSFDWFDDSFLKRYDIVHFHRTLPMIKNGGVEHVYGDDFKKIMKRFKKFNIKTIMDLDDYWMVSKSHPAYESFKKMDINKKIIENIKQSDYITTTTSIFSDIIKQYNKNVIVTPNAVDPTHEQFKSNKETTNKKMRVGWLGGSAHLDDLSLSSEGVTNFLSKHKEDTQFVLCGFDTRGFKWDMNPETRQPYKRKVRPEETVWSSYEKMFTKDYTLLSDEYVGDLLKFEDTLNDSDELYRRVWTKPITSYAENYNLFDVSIAPIVSNKFNLVKSQLKVIESGFHKNALIASDFGPYQIDLVNAFKKGGGINENGNSFLVREHRGHKEWDKYLGILYKTDGLVDLLGENLFKSVQKYHINEITKLRSDFYKEVMSQGQLKEETIDEINNH